MLDDLRNSAQSQYDQNQPAQQSIPQERFEGERGPFLGMTAAQRFVVILLLLGVTCILGTFCLLIFEKISLPFF